MDVTKFLEYYETHRKFFAALVFAVGVAVAFAADGEFSVNDALGTLSAFVGAGAVERVPNDSPVKAAAKRVVRETKDA